MSSVFARCWNMKCFPWKEPQCTVAGACPWHAGCLAKWLPGHSWCPATPVQVATLLQCFALHPSHLPNKRLRTNRIVLLHLCTLFITRVWNLGASCELRVFFTLLGILMLTNYVWNQMVRPRGGQAVTRLLFALKLSSVCCCSLSTPFLYLYQATLLF